MSTEHPTALSRRTLAAGVAWAAPAVAVAAAAPHVAASPIIPPCITFAYTANACRRSNEGIYKFGFCITNTCPKETITLSVTQIRNGANKPLSTTPNPFPKSQELAPGEKLCVSERIWVAASQSSTITVYGTVNGGPEVILYADVPAPQKNDTCAPGFVA